MTHLKIFGLPRTGTNWITYSLRMTWPHHLMVWQNAGPQSGHKFWKHGEFKEVPGIDGYIHTMRSYEPWLESVTKYKGFDERYARFVYDGWTVNECEFGVDTKTPIYGFWLPEDMDKRRSELRGMMQDIEEDYSLPSVEYHIEERRLRRMGDEIPINEWTFETQTVL